jgi:hypothetical protein
MIDSDTLIYCLIAIATICSLSVVGIFLHNSILNKRADSHNNKLENDRFVFIWNFIKWVIGGVFVYFIVIMIHNGIEDKELGIEEMKQYDSYVNTLVTNNDIDIKINLAKFYATITPDKNLRQRWNIYLSFLDSTAFQIKLVKDSLLSKHLSDSVRILLNTKLNQLKKSVITNSTEGYIMMEDGQPLVLESYKATDTLKISKIDITFYDINKIINYSLVVSILQEGANINNQTFSSDYFKKFENQNSCTIAYPLSMLKSKMIDEPVNFFIPANPPAQGTSVDMTFDMKIYFSDGTTKIVKNQTTKIILGVPYLAGMVSLKPFL